MPRYPLVVACLSILSTRTTVHMVGALRAPPGLRRRIRSSSLSAARILCYGDSLTAGTSPPLDDLHPYGPHLERALNVGTAGVPMAVVRWRGLPGWTSSLMLASADDGQAGLRSAIRGISNPSLSLVIILAGANDLAYETSSEPIVESVVGLHQLCHGEGVRRTVAVGIPPSAWQETSAEARDVADEANRALEAFCASTSEVDGGGVATFVPFPFPFGRGDERWAPDGLHLSPAGFEALGVGLAPAVRKVLDESEKDS